MNLSAVIKTLEWAAARVEHAWCQGYLARDGTHCVVGAIELEAGDYAAGQEAIETLAETLALRADHEHWVTDRLLVMNWNDRTGRTAAQVSYALLAAADRLRLPAREPLGLLATRLIEAAVTAERAAVAHDLLTAPSRRFVAEQLLGHEVLVTTAAESGLLTRLS